LGTVSRAFGFLIGDIVTIIRLAWAPLLASALLQYYFGGEIMQAALQTTQNSDPTRMMAYMPQQFLMGLVQFLAGIIALVVLLRVVIFGDRKPGLFVYLWFGGAEIRIVAVSILLLIAIIAGFIGVAIVFGLLGALASQVPVLGIAVGILAIVAVFVVLWIVLRLTLISPVIVAESGLGVERSWALMKGNALRMFLILLLTFIPLTIVSWLVFVAALGGDFPAFPDIFSGMAKPGNQAEIQAAINQWQTQLMQAYSKHWLVLNVLGFIYNLVSTALVAGLTGSAYVAASGKNG